MTLPKLFDGRVFILGGGPSLDRATVDRLRGYHVIAINSVARWCPWAEVLVFSDWSWCRDNRPLVDAWPGMIVTSSARAARVLPDHLRVALVPPLPGMTSGHLAVDVAAELGAAEVVLLGFNCRTVAGRSHCHDDYAAQWSDTVYRERILPLWAGWRARMEAKGVRVINATRGSAIMEFETASLDALLKT